MNQKQRDYLTKRLQKLAEEKKASFKVEDPDLTPFKKKLKTDPAKISAKLKDQVSESHLGYGNNSQVDGLSFGSVYIYAEDYYTNFHEVNKEAQAFCKKHYKLYDDRLASVNKKCQTLCDKIVFAESYEEALAVLEEFTKF